LEELRVKVAAVTRVKVESQRLIFSGQEMNDNTRTLDSYRVLRMSTIYLVTRAEGGAAALKVPTASDHGLDTPEKIIAKALSLGLTTTTDVDKICMQTLDKGEDAPRIVMRCGHPITVVGLKDYTEGLVDGTNSDASPYKITCPFVKADKKICGAVWDYTLWSEAAAMSVEEKNVVSAKLSANYVKAQPSIKTCPWCQSFCEVPGAGANRCQCGIAACKKPFCRVCMSKMPVAGLSSNFCPKCDDLNTFLQREGSKTIKVINVDTAQVRVCPNPNCRRLITHSGTGCKHVHCDPVKGVAGGCGKYFCFLCLKSPTGGVWPCGGMNDPCPIAPIQQF